MNTKITKYFIILIIINFRGAIQHMPGSLLAQRAMMILACVIGSFGMIGAVASMDLVNAGMVRGLEIENQCLPKRSLI